MARAPRMTPYRSGRCWVGLVCWLVVLVLIATPSIADEALPIDVSKASVTVDEPATLVIWNRPIVTLRAKIDAMSPQTRVERIRERIADWPPDALTGTAKPVPATLGDLSGYWIYLEGRTVLALLPQDVDPDSGQTLEQLAEATADNLMAALRARADQQRLPRIIRGVILALLTTALFALTLWGVARLRNRALHRRVQVFSDHPILVRGIDLRPHLRALEDAAIKFTAIGVGLLATYLWLTLLLSFFSYTEPWGEGLAHWLVGRLSTLASGAVSALPGLFTVIIIFLATRLIVQATDRFFASVERGWLKVSWLEAETARATRRLAVVLIWIFALTVAYPYIPGSQSDAFKGISVFIGLMVSLGSAGFVNQIMSGLVIVYSRSLKPGEFVQVGDTFGKITEIGLLATKMITPTRQEISFPNAALVSTSVTNFSRHADAAHGSIIDTTITIGYDAPWRQVHAMLLLAAERTSQVRMEPKPRVLQQALSDFYVEYRLLVSVDDPETRPAILSELHAHIQDVFNEFGVQILSPHFENQPAEKVWVPQSAWHEPPAEPAPGRTTDTTGPA